MVVYYSICLLITLFELAWLEMSDVRQSLSQFVSVLAIILSDIGYIYLSCSTSFKEAVLADKITRIGGCFLPLFFFFMVCEVCHVSISKWVVLLLASIQSFLYSMIALFNFNVPFYYNVGFYSDVSGGHLIWKYGPLHTVYMATIIMYFIAIVGVSCVTIKKNKSVNNKDLIRLVASSLIVFVGVVIDRLMNLHTEIIPAFYCLVMYGALGPIYNSNIFTVYENRNIINKQLNEVGFIAFDTKLHYMGCNDLMLKLFPELKSLDVGKSIQDYSRDFQRFILLPVRYYRDYFLGTSDQGSLDTKNSFKLKNSYYEERIHVIRDFMGRVKGFTVVVTDNTEHHEAIKLSEQYSEQLSKDVNIKTKKIRSIQSKIILGMAQVVESRDLSTGGHVKRTSDVVRIFSEQLLVADLGLDKKFLRLVERSAPMHDLGKIGVDDSILRFNGRYNDEQYAEMKKHSEIGAGMVRKILTGVEEEQFVQIAENIAHYHHEKVNGMGYPCGLKGEEIPIEARIMAIADVFDALVSKRCYKDSFSYNDAFDIIQKDAGSHFDAELVKVFMKCRHKLELYYNEEKKKGCN